MTIIFIKHTETTQKNVARPRYTQKLFREQSIVNETSLEKLQAQTCVGDYNF